MGGIRLSKGRFVLPGHDSKVKAGRRDGLWAAVLNSLLFRKDAPAFRGRSGGNCEARCRRLTMKHTRLSGTIIVAAAALLFISACGKAPAPQADTQAPEVVIISPTVSVSSEFELRGSVFDDTGVTAASFTLNGAEGDLALTDGNFNTALALVAGQNAITVTASDEAGNATTE